MCFVFFRFQWGMKGVRTLTFASLSDTRRYFASERLLHPVKRVSKASVKCETNCGSGSETCSSAFDRERRSVALNMRLVRLAGRGAVLGGVAVGLATEVDIRRWVGVELVAADVGGFIVEVKLGVRGRVVEPLTGVCDLLAIRTSPKLGIRYHDFEVGKRRRFRG